MLNLHQTVKCSWLCRFSVILLSILSGVHSHQTESTLSCVALASELITAKAKTNLSDHRTKNCSTEHRNDHGYHNAELGRG